MKMFEDELGLGGSYGGVAGDVVEDQCAQRIGVGRGDVDEVVVLAGEVEDVLADQPDGTGRAPEVRIAASGAVLPEVLTAAAELAEEGIAAHVIDITSADRLYTAWQRTLRQGVRTATTPSIPGALRAAFGPGAAPVVTVHDASSHAMAWIGSALGVPQVPLGVDEFGQSGTVADLYELHDLLPGRIVNAALAASSI